MLYFTGEHVVWCWQFTGNVCLVKSPTKVHIIL